MWIRSASSSSIVSKVPSTTLTSNETNVNNSCGTNLTSIKCTLSQLNYCNFCRTTTEPSSEPLIRCSDCQKVAYCRSEHQKLDLLQHKINCQKWKRTDSSIGGDSGFTPSTSIINGCNMTNSSNKSIGSSVSSTSFSSVLPSTSFMNGNLVSKPNLNADDDIQVIAMINRAQESQKTRKRTLDRNGRKFKDHSKNLLYKVSFKEHVSMLMSRGLFLNNHQATALRLKYIAEHVIRSLNEFGWAVVDHFLGKTYCDRVYSEVERLYTKGMFSAGQLMDSGNNDLNPEDIRSDKILWFANDDSSEVVRKSLTIRLLIAMLDSVVVNFNGRIHPFEIAGRSKAMIAVYPGNGTRYVKHVDNPVKDGRCITVIYYCNDNWKLAEHGGTLRLYPETSEMPMDVDPQADRLIFFWSDRRIPHEVLPVFRHRYAITIWYFDLTERKAAIDRAKDQTSNKRDETPNTTVTAVITETSTDLNLNLNGNEEESTQNNSTFELLRNDTELTEVTEELHKQELQEAHLDHTSNVQNSSDNALQLSENDAFKMNSLCTSYTVKASYGEDDDSCTEDEEDIDVLKHVEGKRQQSHYFEI